LLYVIGVERPEPEGEPPRRQDAKEISADCSLSLALLASWRFIFSGLTRAT